MKSNNSIRSKMHASPSTSIAIAVDGGEAKRDGRATAPSPGAASAHASNGDSPVSAATAASSAASSATRDTASTADSAHSRQNRKVFAIRLAVIAALVAAAATVATFTGTYISADETSNFELEYNASVSQVAEGFQHGIDTKHDIAKSFGATITSRYGDAARRAEGRGPLWPNVTIPDFRELSEGMLRISGGRALSFNPIVREGVDRWHWEAHAVENEWTLGKLDFPWDSGVSFGIYSRDTDGQVIYDPGYSPESPPQFQDVMVPVWQITPIETNEKAVMFNLHSETNRREALDHMLEHKVPVLTAILQLVQDDDTRPSSILFYPVFDTFKSKQNDLNKNENDEREDFGSVNEEQKVVGSISIVFSWDNLLKRLLPDYIKGMVCVLQSSTGQTVSYSISGDSVMFLGEGDKHDPTYGRYRRSVQAKLLLEGTQKFITYQLHIFPSREFEAQYVTSRAAIYSAGVVLIFLFTSALFLTYDYLVEDRQKRTARMARRRGVIVDELFPAVFRERLYRLHSRDDGAGAMPSSMRRRGSGSGRSASSTLRGSAARRSSAASSADDASAISGSVASHRGSAISLSLSSRSKTPSLGKRKPTSTLRSSLRSAMRLKIALKHIDNPVASGQPRSKDTDYFEDEPIAELFLGTSIMFSDIVVRTFALSRPVCLYSLCLLLGNIFYVSLT